MQQDKQIIQLSDHVKNKLKSRQLTPLSLTSDEIFISDEPDDESESLISTSAKKFLTKRNSTFIIHRNREPSGSDSVFTYKTNNSKQTQLCQECLRRESLIKTENQRLLDIQKENKKLSQQLRSSVLLNQQYQEENYRLKQHLTKINMHLRECQINLDLLRQKILAEKTNKTKEDAENEHLRRLRHELHVYNQVIANKRREEQKQIDYFYQFRRK